MNSRVPGQCCHTTDWRISVTKYFLWYNYQYMNKMVVNMKSSKNDE